MRRKFVVIVAGLALGITGMAVSLSAHHAFAAEFDANKPLQMKGTVTKMEWLNPHVCLHMDVKQPDGTVVIDGYRAKDWSRRANGRDLTFEDGKKLFMGSSGTGAPYELNQKSTPDR